MSNNTTHKLLTLDSNIFVGAIKKDEPYRSKCLEILRRIPDSFVLAEPSIIYEQVCGTIARRVGIKDAERTIVELDRLIPERLLFDCDRGFCLSSYALCSEFGIYAIDALFLSVAINSKSMLVSLDREDFIDKLGENKYGIEAYHVAEFPYQ